MSIAENKAVVNRWFDDFWHARNIDVADEILHPDYIFGDDLAPGAASIQAAKEGNTFWHLVLPDIHFTLDEVISEGDTVVVRWTAHGTHRGEWVTDIGTVPASGKATVTPGTSTFHFRDGKIIQDINHIDFLSTLKQIGVVLPSNDTRS